MPTKYTDQLPTYTVHNTPFRLRRHELLDQVGQAIKEETILILQAKLFAMLKNCTTCRHWSLTRLETCDLCGVRPPAHIIAYGCSSYLDLIADDATPF